MGHFAQDHQATNMISLLLLAGAVAAHPYYYMPYAGLQGRAEPNVDEATAAAVGTSGVSGTVRIFQNPFISNDDSRYTIEIVGLAAGTNYWVCLLPTNLQTSTTPVITDFVTAGLTAADTTTPKALHNGAAPSFQLFNRFTVKGSNTEFNIDAASAKRDVNDVGVGIFSRA